MSRWVSRGLVAVLFAAIYPHLQNYGHAVRRLVSNLPHQIEEHSAFSAHKIVFADKIRNCEDSLLDEELGIAYFSCDPGRDRWNTVLGVFIDSRWKAGSIYYYEYAQHSYEEPGEVQKLDITGWTEKARTQFHPLGIGRKGSSRDLFVANHDPDGPSVEQLRLSPDGKSAEHVRTIKHELLHAPNSIAPLSDTELLITNDHYFVAEHHPILSKIETYLSPPLSSVVHYDLKTGQAEVLVRQGFSNGIAPLNGTHLAVASTSIASVHIYAMDIFSRKLKRTMTLRAGFFTDNLRVDSAGKLLIAGHPHPRPLDKLARSNHKYNLDNDPLATELLDEKDRLRSGSWVAEWDGNERGILTNLYVTNEFDAACAAARDVKRGVGFVSGLYGKGVVLWKE